MEITHNNLKLLNKPTPKMIYELLENIFNSNLSIEEYCSENGYSVNSIKKYCLKYINSNNKNKIMIASSLLERDSSDFILKLKNDVLSSLAFNDIDILDYLEITRLQSSDFRELLKNYIPIEIINKILRCANLNKLRPFSGEFIFDINKSAILNGKIVLNGIEASTDDKIKIYNYLEANNYPITLFKMALKKYLNGNLEIDGKKYIKK